MIHAKHPLPSSRYRPFGEVSCKFHQPNHALPSSLFAYLGRRVEQSITVLSIATCHNHDFPSPAVEVVFSCILLDVEQRQRKQLKKISQSLQPCCARSDCTDKRLGSNCKRAVTASPYTAPEPGMTWHTQGTPATIGEHNPSVCVQGSHEKNSSTLKCPWQNTRNISSETYMFLLGMTTQAGVHHIYYMLYK